MTESFPIGAPEAPEEEVTPESLIDEVVSGQEDAESSEVVDEVLEDVERSEFEESGLDIPPTEALLGLDDSDVEDGLLDDEFDMEHMSPVEQGIVRNIKRGPFNRAKNALFAAIVIFGSFGTPSAEAGDNGFKDFAKGLGERVLRNAGREMEKTASKIGKTIGDLPEEELSRMHDKRILNKKIAETEARIDEYNARIAELESQTGAQTAEMVKAKEAIEHYLQDLALNSPAVAAKVKLRDFDNLEKAYSGKRGSDGALSAADQSQYDKALADLNSSAKQRADFFQNKIALMKSGGMSESNAMRVILGEAKEINDKRSRIKRHLDSMYSSQARGVRSKIGSYKRAISTEHRNLRSLHKRLDHVLEQQNRQRTGDPDWRRGNR